MNRQVLLYTDDFRAAAAEIENAGGRPLHVFSQRVFVAALPDGGWRLHDLFRDFLRAKLRRTHPKQWAELNRRIADELLAEGRTAEAITLLIGGGIHEPAAELLLARAEELSIRT